MERKVIISQLHNENYVFDFADGSCTQVYKANENVLSIGTLIIAKIKDIKTDLNAAFVDLGNNISGYLSFDDCNERFLLSREFDGKYKEGDEILVMVKRLPIKSKPYSLTMYPEFATDTCVISTKGTGISISKKLSKDISESILKDISCSFANKFDKEYACLIRTKAKDINTEVLIENIENSLNAFKNILEYSPNRKLFSIIYKPQSDYIKRITDGKLDKPKIITDVTGIFEDLNGLENVEFYKDERISLKSLYSLERYYSEACNECVYLKCGGFLIINYTEALTVIDVNSGKCSIGKDKNKISHLVNVEACDEIYRQLILRNISGIIIVDFINTTKDSERDLLAYMNKLTREDIVKTTVVDFTKLGLMEITRQKIYPSIYD